MFGGGLYSTHSSLFDLGCRVSILPCFMPDPTYLILNIHLIINTVQNIASLVVCVLIGNWCYDDLDDPLHRCQLGLLYDGLKIKLKRWKLVLVTSKIRAKQGQKRVRKLCFRGRQVGAFSVFWPRYTGGPFIFWAKSRFLRFFVRLRG